jgi:hypothetical protein
MVRSTPRRAPDAQLLSFECSCGTIHNSPDQQIPVGWSTRHGQVWCFDCTRAGVPQRLLHGGSRRRRKAA